MEEKETNPNGYWMPPWSRFKISLKLKACNLFMGFECWQLNAIFSCMQVQLPINVKIMFSFYFSYLLNSSSGVSVVWMGNTRQIVQRRHPKENYNVWIVAKETSQFGGQRLGTRSRYYYSICPTFQRFPFRATQRSKVKTFCDGRKNQNNPSQHFLTLPICVALKGKRWKVGQMLL